MNNRILYSKNGVLQDSSLALDNLYSGDKTFDYVAGQDFIYIGARLPFNHIYMKLGAVVNAVLSAVMKIEYYDGIQWREVVEIVDDTQVLSRSGIIQFTPNKRFKWVARSTNDAGEKVTGLESVVIYDRYWLRISFSVDLTPAIALSWVGNIFASDEDLYVEFSEMKKQAFKTGHTVGKTDWFEQHAVTGKLIVNELANQGVIVEKGQILDWRNYTLAAVSKCAEVIFNNMGDDYVDQTNSARAEFKSRVTVKVARVDSNADAIEQPEESVNTTGWFSR